MAKPKKVVSNRARTSVASLSRARNGAQTTLTSLPPKAADQEDSAIAFVRLRIPSEILRTCDVPTIKTRWERKVEKATKDFSNVGTGIPSMPSHISNTAQIEEMEVQVEDAKLCVFPNAALEIDLNHGQQSTQQELLAGPEDPPPIHNPHKLNLHGLPSIFYTSSCNPTKQSSICRTQVNNTLFSQEQQIETDNQSIATRKKACSRLSDTLLSSDPRLVVEGEDCLVQQTSEPLLRTTNEPAPRVPEEGVTTYPTGFDKQIPTTTRSRIRLKVLSLPEIEEMAPVRDPNSVDVSLKDAIQKLYEIQSQVHGFVPDTQPLLVDKMTELAHSLSHLQDLTSTTISPNNPVHRDRIAPEVIDYVDDSRNPDIYNREFVELVQRGNAVINGKQQAFKDFTEIFAESLRTGFPEIGGEIDMVLNNAGFDKNTSLVAGSDGVNGVAKSDQRADGRKGNESNANGASSG